MALQIHPANPKYQLNVVSPDSPLFTTPTTLAFRAPNFTRRLGRRSSFCCQSSVVDDRPETSTFTDPETKLIEALIGIQGRGRSASPQQLNDVERAVQVLEASQGVPDPTSSDLIEGRWQLMFTTRPGTASPIQRTFVGVDFFSVFQEIYLKTNDPRVSNIVKFSDAIGELKVEAAASTKDGKRILFRFDKAAFSFKFLPFKVPYPVPFRLLGDEAKGWLDTTYLSQSGNLRISKGNKLMNSKVVFFLRQLENGLVVQGTTFVLQKMTEPRQRLLSSISKGERVREAIDAFLSKNKVENEEAELQEGEWTMIWSSQIETDSWIENAANGLMGSQIVSKDGRIKFVAKIVPGFRFSMNGTFVKSGADEYELMMNDGAIIGGPFGYPVELENKIKLKVLYTDDKIRITRGYNSIIFVHLRADGSTK